jgi:hypothetical protein
VPDDQIRAIHDAPTLNFACGSGQTSPRKPRSVNENSLTEWQSSTLLMPPARKRNGDSFATQNSEASRPCKQRGNTIELEDLEKDLANGCSAEEGEAANQLVLDAKQWSRIPPPSSNNHRSESHLKLGLSDSQCHERRMTQQNKKEFPPTNLLDMNVPAESAGFDGNDSIDPRLKKALELSAEEEHNL